MTSSKGAGQQEKNSVMKKGKSSKSWREKLEKKMEPKIVQVPDGWAARIGHGRVLVPNPMLVDNTIREIPEAKLATVNTIREKMAHDFNADMACPLTTGIFLNIAVNVAEEDKQHHKKHITPYWRVVKEDGSLNTKYPGGADKQAKYLKGEGLTIKVTGKKDKLYVKDFENYLYTFG